MVASWEDMVTMCEMAAEEDDDSMLPELKAEFQKLSEAMESCRLETLLTGKYDKNNALMSFQAGAVISKLKYAQWVHVEQIGEVIHIAFAT